jgi:hypothetical protein
VRRAVLDPNVLISGDGDLTGLADPQPPVFTPRTFLDSLQDAR